MHVCVLAAYGVGMLTAYIALTMMERAQPALLYLVPCTLTPVYAVAVLRGHVKVMWNGDQVSAGGDCVCT